MNNFNTSTTGINIKTSIIYDADLAQMYFHENFKSVEGGYIYIDCDQLDDEPTPECKLMEITGYSQGDYAKVWYNPTEIEKLWGNAPNEKNLKEQFEQYFYDQPIDISVTINDKEIRGFEYGSDLYEYDKEETIKAIVSIA